MRRRIQISQRTGDSSEAMINLTPLIDVVFVMLIMFIVVAPILELDQIELAKGSPQAKEVSSTIQETSPVVIHVRRDNTILFNKQSVSIEQLKRLLMESKQRYPDSVPLLFHDKKAYFGTYQDVKNAVETTGFKEINVILNPG